MTTFQDLGVREDLLRAIAELGYESPMPIQEKVIPHLLNEDSDVVGLAQTGTGKTAAFGLPTLQRVDTTTKVTQAIILDPTRELCMQTCNDLNDYAKYIDDLRILPVYGGSSIEVQIRALRKGVQIIVATPGRLLDLIKRGEVNLENVNTVILDEADEMLNMGFVDDINNILEHVPDTRKMLMFSATMPPEIASIAKNYMHNPQEYIIGTRNEGSANVRHIYYMVRANDKYLALKRICDYLPRVYGIIFCRTRATTQEIATKLIEDGYDADALHGDLSQAQRDAVMKKFRERNLQLLVATDVAARGLDVDNLTHIISYSLPDDNAVYNHRSGRTGRAGKTGVSIALIHSRERNKLRDIEKHIGKTFERCEVPKPNAIIEKQLFNLADRLEKVEVKEDEIAEFMPSVLKKLSWLDSEDLLKRMLSLEFNRLIEYYKDAPELDYVPEKEKSKREKRAKVKYDNTRDKDCRTAEEGYERVFVNAGKADGFFAPSLIELLNRNTHGERVDLGRIDLLSNYSLFDVKAGDAKRVVKALKNADFFGKRIYAEVASLDKNYASETEGTEVKLNRKERRRQQFSSKERFGERRGGGKKGFRDERDERRTRRDNERGFKKGDKGSAKGAHKVVHGNFDKFKKKKGERS
ncbi:MAG: DEAD/DEAH box helicase [Sodaliphilus sp.]|nr:DEAD/DEAH box helicase [Sodaliphilus sp.]